MDKTSWTLGTYDGDEGAPAVEPNVAPHRREQLYDRLHHKAEIIPGAYIESCWGNGQFHWVGGGDIFPPSSYKNAQNLVNKFNFCYYLFSYVPLFFLGGGGRDNTYISLDVKVLILHFRKVEVHADHLLLAVVEQIFR